MARSDLDDYALFRQFSHLLGMHAQQCAVYIGIMLPQERRWACRTTRGFGELEAELIHYIRADFRVLQGDVVLAVLQLRVAG